MLVILAPRRKAEGLEFKVILFHFTASLRPSELPGTNKQLFT